MKFLGVPVKGLAFISVSLLLCLGWALVSYDAAEVKATLLIGALGLGITFVLGLLGQFDRVSDKEAGIKKGGQGR